VQIQNPLCVCCEGKPLYWLCHEPLFGYLFQTPVDVRFEVLMAVAMKNAVFWDIRTQFVPHRRHITSPLQSPAG
jgi:hypothetical protein